MYRLFHRDRSLEQLEDTRWPDPPGDSTGLVKTVHALRRNALGALTVGDLRTLIAQNVGLPYLLPLAVQVLRDDPMAEGNYYEGDLLSVVLTRSPDSWLMFPDLAQDLAAIVSGMSDLPSHLGREAESFLGSTGRQGAR